MSMRPGMIVEIHSLQTAIALNGELGELGVYSVAAERWQVQLLTRSVGKMVRQQNLKAAPSPSNENLERANGLIEEGSKLLDMSRSKSGAAADADASTARVLLTQALELHPTCARAHGLLGDYSHMRSDWVQMLKHFRRADANLVHGEECSLHVQMGHANALKESGYDAEARDLYRQLKAERPRVMLVRYNLADALRNIDREASAAEAREILNEAAEWEVGGGLSANQLRAAATSLLVMIAHAKAKEAMQKYGLGAETVAACESVLAIAQKGLKAAYALFVIGRCREADAYVKLQAGEYMAALDLFAGRLGEDGKSIDVAPGSAAAAFRDSVDAEYDKASASQYARMQGIAHHLTGGVIFLDFANGKQTEQSAGFMNFFGVCCGGEKVESPDPTGSKATAGFGEQPAAEGTEVEQVAAAGVRDVGGGSNDSHIDDVVANGIAVDIANAMDLTDHDPSPVKSEPVLSASAVAPAEAPSSSEQFYGVRRRTRAAAMLDVRELTAEEATTMKSMSPNFDKVIAEYAAKAVAAEKKRKLRHRPRTFDADKEYNNANIFKCPSCFAPNYYEMDACNVLRCFNCSVRFCIKCLQPLKTGESVHARCTLYT